MTTDALDAVDILGALPLAVRVHGAFNVDTDEDGRTLLVSFCDATWLAFRRDGPGWRQLGVRPAIVPACIAGYETITDDCACPSCLRHEGRASPADVRRLSDLGTIPCREAHTHNVLGERVDEEHSLAECGSKPMVELLGEDLPSLALYAMCKRRGEHVLDSGGKNCATCGLARDSGGLAELWPEERGVPAPSPPSMRLVRCECGAQFTAPTPGSERVCTSCGTLH